MGAEPMAILVTAALAAMEDQTEVTEKTVTTTVVAKAAASISELFL